MKMDYFSNWHRRLFTALKIYLKVTTQISSVVRCKKTVDKTKIIAIKMILIGAEDELLSAEREILSEQFNSTEDDVQAAYEQCYAGSVKCQLFLN